MRAPQGCLRYLVPFGWLECHFELPERRDLVRTALYKNASELTSSRLSDYSLVKERHSYHYAYFVSKFAPQISLQSLQTAEGNFRRHRRGPSLTSAWGGGILSFFPPLSTGCREDFFASSRRLIDSLTACREKVYRPAGSTFFRPLGPPLKTVFAAATIHPFPTADFSKECCVKQLAAINHQPLRFQHYSRLITGGRY